MDISKYSKLIAAVVGVLFAAGAVWGLVDSSGHLFGMDQATATTIFSALAAAVFTYFAPKNTT